MDPELNAENAARYAALSARSVFALTGDEHRWLLAYRRANLRDNWAENQVGGFAGTPSELGNRDILAMAWRWWRGV